MKLAFCIFKYFPFGGLQRDFFRIVSECKQRGHQITVYTFFWEGDIPDGIELKFVPKKYISNHKNAEYFSNYIAGEKKNNSYDVIVGFNRMANLDIYFAGDNCLAEKYRDRNLYKLFPRYRIFQKLEQAIFDSDKRTRIMILTERQKKEYQKHYSTQDDRFFMLPAGIAEDYKYPDNADAIRETIRDSLNIPLGHKVIIQVGSGFKTKGLERSLVAISSLPQHLKDKVLFLIAGRDNEKYYIALSKKLKIDKIVRFLGGRSDVPDLLVASDLMVHPATNEAGGMVLIEAISCGLPVLCTAICGYSTYIKKADSGIVTDEPFCQNNLNKTLQQMLENEEALQIMRNNALSFSRQENFFNRHIVATDYIVSGQEIT